MVDYVYQAKISKFDRNMHACVNVINQALLPLIHKNPQEVYFRMGKHVAERAIERDVQYSFLARLTSYIAEHYLAKLLTREKTHHMIHYKDCVLMMESAFHEQTNKYEVRLVTILVKTWQQDNVFLNQKKNIKINHYEVSLKEMMSYVPKNLECGIPSHIQTRMKRELTPCLSSK